MVCTTALSRTRVPSSEAVAPAERGRRDADAMPGAWPCIFPEAKGRRRCMTCETLPATCLEVTHDATLYNSSDEVYRLVSQMSADKTNKVDGAVDGTVYNLYRTRDALGRRRFGRGKPLRPVKLHVSGMPEARLAATKERLKAVRDPLWSTRARGVDRIVVRANAAQRVVHERRWPTHPGNLTLIWPLWEMGFGDGAMCRRAEPSSTQTP